MRNRFWKHPILLQFTRLVFAACFCLRFAAAMRSVHQIQQQQIPQAASSDRAMWITHLDKLASPVLEALSKNQLKATMPKVGISTIQAFAPLEATGRLLLGMAPWLELGPGTDAEGQLRSKYIQLAVKGISNAVNPAAADYMQFRGPGQPLVDASFLALALMRSKRRLWGNLAPQTKANVITALYAARRIKPLNNNWLLFSATIETALWEFTGSYNITPISTAITKHLEWYKGDGIFGDGQNYRNDYYNSYVIHPMMLSTLQILKQKGHSLGSHYATQLRRSQRYATVLERLVSPEGTFPIIGRSSVYRFAAFHHLSALALSRQLPSDMNPAAARSALTAVIRNMMEADGTFDAKGWLRLGTVGYQPAQTERYINTGSLYMTTLGLSALGLPASDAFWSRSAAPWTQKRLWSGENLPGDGALNG
jgi:hypothetical protein